MSRRHVLPKQGGEACAHHIVDARGASAEVEFDERGIVKSRECILRIEVIEAPQLAQYSRRNCDVLGEYRKLCTAGSIGAIKKVHADA